MPWLEKSHSVVLFISLQAGVSTPPVGDDIIPTPCSLTVEPFFLKPLNLLQAEDRWRRKEWKIRRQSLILQVIPLVHPISLQARISSGRQSMCQQPESGWRTQRTALFGTSSTSASRGAVDTSKHTEQPQGNPLIHQSNSLVSPELLQAEAAVIRRNMPEQPAQ